MFGQISSAKFRLVHIRSCYVWSGKFSSG